jgi:DNA modification methylase
VPALYEEWGLRDYQCEGQIGLEPTLEEYLERLLVITAELKRVFKPSGILFWNHGDCYGGSGCGSHDYRDETSTGILRKRDREKYQNKPVPHLKLTPKSLTLQNFRLVLRMIDEQGWILRNTIIWHKPNHMPASVKDRFTSAYEPVFMLVKNKKYYFDLDAVRVPQKYPEDVARRIRQDKEDGIFPFNKNSPLARRSIAFNYRVRDAEKESEQCPQFKATKEEIERYRHTHYPQDQAESFGSPRARYWREEEKKEIQQLSVAIRIVKNKEYKKRDPERHISLAGKNPGDVWSISTQPFTEAHFATFPEKLVEPMILAGCPTEGIVLDPFAGSGTVAVVAKKLGRDFIGIDISEKYCQIARKRLSKIPERLNRWM